MPQSSQQQPQSQQQSQQQNSSSSHTHLQAIPHQYYGHGQCPNAGTGHNNSYNKSSSYPNFASNLSSSSGGSGASIKHHVQHLQQSQGQHQIQQQQQPQPQPQPQQTHHTQQQPHVPHGNFMYHRHSLNNISAHQHQQQFLQQLQNQQQQQQQSQLLPSIFLTAMTGGGGGPLPTKGKSQPTDAAGSIAADVPVPKSSPVDLLGSKSQTNSIGDINSRLEFLCLQMTEQAIN